MRTVTPGDHFELAEGTVLLSGIQALVRLLLTQRQLDTARGLSTGLFISGYEGSPLGGLDQQLMRSHALLDKNGIVFTPGVNEELAATAVGGTQLIGELPGRRVDGVTGFWYGKNPGLDRAADAIRHASMSGTNPLGGAVALVGDDPQCKSSTLPSSCELMARSLNTPLFAPASVSDIVPLGLHAVGLSRYAGVWSMLKIVSDLADATATVTFPALDQLGIPQPDSHRAWRPPDMLGPSTVALEEHLLGVRIPRIHEYVETVGLNRAVVNPANARLAVIATGLGYAAARRALSELGFSNEDLERCGIRIIKVDLPWPLSTAALRAMVDTVSAVLVVEDKAPLIEVQLKAALYGQRHQPAVSGKETATDEPLLPPFGAMTSEVVTRALAHVLSTFDLPEALARQVERHRAGVPSRINLLAEPAPTPRTPYFCSGCPHNISTQAPDDQLIGLGIGCHLMAVFDDTGRGHKVGMTQMGGEGAQWIGMAPFTDDGHYAQNLGDGTFFHSGSLAIRAAVAANMTMTYKILYNDAVAMTGGQTPIGTIGIPALTHWLALEGVKKIIVTTPDPGEFNVAEFHSIASVQHRDTLPAAQRDLAAVAGVTALVHHDPCAAEERRLRNRGQRPALKESVWINSRVCEGCGDCAEKATCMSLVHVPTEFGRKMSVHQGSCNLDTTCVKGECPSFVIARHGRGGLLSAQTALPAPPQHLPDPTPAPWTGSTVIRMLGIGGTGVVTVSRVLQMAAHLAGLHAAGIDQLGLSQKGGPVTSDVRIARDPIEGDVHASPSGVDVLLGFDLLGAASDSALAVAAPETTVAVLNLAEAPTASMLRHQDIDFPLAAGLRSRIGRATRAADMVCLDAQLIAESLAGNHMAANFVLAGAAFQAGLFPLGTAEFDEAFRLNGVDVDTSRIAFLWGRAAVADPDLVANALCADDAAPAVPDAKPASLPTDLAPDPTWPDALRSAVAHRTTDLIAFQSRRLALDYRERVGRVAEQERQRTDDSDLPITDAFARGLYALTATKDEYEVARLHLLPEEQAAFAAAFPGARRVYLLKPPLLAALGLQRKIKLVRTARPAFASLRAARRLRGTPFDVFGWSAERRAERRFLAEYLRHVDAALSDLRVETAEVVHALVDQANQVHGYSHVRSAAMERSRAASTALFSQLDSLRSATPERSSTS